MEAYISTDRYRKNPYRMKYYRIKNRWVNLVHQQNKYFKNAKKKK
jgi:hypothetical protein